MVPVEPGTELKGVLEELGLYAEHCDCRARVEMMNKWGLAECSKVERFNEIVDWLRDEARKRAWWEKSLAALRALQTRLVWEAFSLRDPAPAIVREALRRTHVKETENAAHNQSHPG